MLKEVRGRRFDRSGNTAVLRQHAATDRVNADSAGIWRILNLEMKLELDRRVAELGALYVNFRGFLIALIVHKSKTGSNCGILFL